MKKFLLFLGFLVVGMIAFAQEQHPMFEEFMSTRKQVRNKKMKSEEKEILAQDYLEKAKKTKDERFIGRGFYLLAVKNDDVKIKHQYLDSAISYTENLKGDKGFPVQAYMYRAHLFFKHKKYQKALDNYFLAAEAEKLSPNVIYKFSIKYNIALLKRFLGEYDEAEVLFLECKAYREEEIISSESIKQEVSKKYIDRYLNILFQLSSIYYETEQSSKCTALNKKGIQLAKQYDDTYMYYAFVVNEGVNLTLKGKHKAAIDSLHKGYPHINNTNKPVVDFYLGKSYFSLNKKEKALHHFKKIDSVFNATNSLFPPLRESYIYLIENTKKKRDKEKQLYYTNQLIKVDSIIHTEYKYMYKNISKKYDIPSLIFNKERLIKELQEDNKIITREKKWILIVFVLFGFAAIGLLLYYRGLKKKYERRYNEILHKSNSIVEEEKIILKDSKTRVVSLDIDENLIDEILEKLEIFKQKEAYLTNQISLKDVAKKLDTNSKYLSKIINSYKGKNFATYINDLRIDYFINKIQKDSTYRKYTIRAIAEEIGFSNPEGFSRAFQKKTGLKPSYFIRKIIEDQKSK
ncbi:helix-turn-helix domain-containing protein [Kordia jejudonensis]|uniref:helix-turn-helix domain-containing protein n=1 Tax=Kordia jejudonensis TaxID=1348245 RepID=UPI0012E06518|nr:helix-turn-helix domain-containing protein [Kordia jejudonensis]